MSSIAKIKARRLDDLINEGYRVPLTGTVGLVTDSVLLAMPTNRAAVITGFTVSTDSASAVLVSLGLKAGSDPTVKFFQTYVINASAVTKVFSVGDWLYGDLGGSVVITTSGGTVAYSIDLRIIHIPTPLGYIEHDGAAGHSAPFFPPESGKDRGQMEV